VTLRSVNRVPRLGLDLRSPPRISRIHRVSVEYYLSLIRASSSYDCWKISQHLDLCILICLVFQQLEIDSIIAESHKELLPGSSGQAPIIRMFGVTREGECF